MNKSNKSERFRAIFWKSPLVLIAIALPGQFLQSTETSGTFAKTSNEFPRGGSWSLVWSDEFDYQGLPDSSKWTCEQGWKRNNESQYYTVGRLENCRVEDGMLVIEARRENFATPEGKLAVYTSASLTTKDRAAWKYGRIEVRAKLPRGKGTWPAIWMLANRSDTLHWPMCGEIDIMEHVGKEPQNVYATIHYGSKRGEHINLNSAVGIGKLGLKS